MKEKRTFVRISGDWSGVYLASNGGSVTGYGIYNLPPGCTGTVSISNRTIRPTPAQHTFSWAGNISVTVKKGEEVVYQITKYFDVVGATSNWITAAYDGAAWVSGYRDFYLPF